MTESSRSTDSMEIGLSISSKVEINDYIDGLNIDTSSKDISANQASCFSIFKVMVNSTSILLLHFRVNVEARISKLRDFLSQKLNSFSVFTKDDCLVDI